MQIIIFENSTGGVSIITPVLNLGKTIEEIAAKSVPTGAAFEIVDDSVIDKSVPIELLRWI